jgi:hypothetical protein
LNITEIHFYGGEFEAIKRGFSCIEAIFVPDALKYQFRRRLILAECRAGKFARDS